MPTKSGSTRPTVLDVARLAGVSPATVSNVLNGRRVRAESASKVKEAAARLGYAADRAASQLRSGRTRVIAMLVPSLENPFFTSLVAALERRLRADGFDLVVASSTDDPPTEQTSLQSLLAWRPAGMLVIPCLDDFGSARTLDAAGTPFVVVDRIGGAHGADTVAVDNEAAGRTAASHLIELGHRRLLIVASTLALSNIQLRCRGIGEACALNGLDSPELVEVGGDLEGAVLRLQAWLRAHERPSAILALTNFATLGTLASLARFSINVPGDVSLVGFDDYAWMRATAPSITAIRQPVEEMADRAWARLRARVEGESGPPQPLTLPASLVVRASTAAPETRMPDYPVERGQPSLERRPSRSKSRASGREVKG